jgi:hypothetical protein
MAGRVNNILKQEWFTPYDFKDARHVRHPPEPAIEPYNTGKPYAGINSLIPVQAKEKTGKSKKRRKNKKTGKSSKSRNRQGYQMSKATRNV